MDNRYFNHGCPALMQDGRFITNFTRARVFDQFIRHTNKLNSAQDFKLFLQSNGETIMNREREYANQMNTCGVEGKCVALGNTDKFPCACDCNRS